jgi:hypothetical protein
LLSAGVHDEEKNGGGRGIAPAARWVARPHANQEVESAGGRWKTLAGEEMDRVKEAGFASSEMVADGGRGKRRERSGQCGLAGLLWFVCWLVKGVVIPSGFFLRIKGSFCKKN